MSIYDQSTLDLLVIAGPSFKEILSEYTAMTGRSPLPPCWTFGLWMSRASYSSRSQVEAICRDLRAKGIPCDVINIDPAWMKEGTWCCFEWDEEMFPHPEEMIARLRENGFRLCLWELPYVPKGTRMCQEGRRTNVIAERSGDGLQISFRGDLAIDALRFHRAGISGEDCRVTANGAALRRLDPEDLRSGNEGWYYDRDEGTLAIGLCGRKEAGVNVVTQ